MFRPMRRFRQQLSDADTMAVFDRATSGVLALAGDDGYPYAVPLSFVRVGTRFYFHCAKQGHKLDAIRRCDKASFCVIDKDEVVPEKYTTYFRSAIAFGRVRILDDEHEMRQAIEALAARYTPEDEAGRLKEIEREYPELCMFVLESEHITGKEAIELVRKKEK